MQMGPAKDRMLNYMDFSHVLVLKPNISTDWSTKGVPQCATTAPQLSQVVVCFFFKVFLSCNAKVSQNTELRC